MPKGELINMVKQSLKGTGERMIELSDTIAEGGGHLSDSDAKLVRMAMVPALQESFEELIHFYMLDNQDMQTEAFRQLDRLIGMRF